MSAELVSILTPSFNQVRWLPDNLRSVEAQTYPHVEHIVVDGGSSDGTVELLRKTGPSVRWISEPDHGQSEALNKAYYRSSGDIVGWLNSDDAYYSRDAIADAVEAFRTDTQIALVYGHGLLVTSEGLIIQTVWAPPFSKPLLTIHNFILQPTVFMRRSFLGDRLVDESYGYTMDRELWLRLCMSGPGSFRRLSTIVSVDRHHAQRKSYTMPDVRRTDRARLARTFGTPNGMASGLVAKAVKMSLRVAGVTLLRDVSHDPACPSHLDSKLRLLVRQLVVPRRWMPQ